MGLFNREEAVFDINENLNNAMPTVPSNHISTNGSGLNLTKNSSINMKKTPIITAKASWNSFTDYDLYALVLLKDGTELTVGTFGSVDQPNPTPSILNGAIKHNGDIGRTINGNAEEIIEIRMTDEIRAIIPVAYSAQSNGTGSFKKYQVSLEIDNGAGEKITINADNANNSNVIYTAVIGAIIHNDDGSITIKNIESYSKRMSENRPKFINGKLYMDKGSINLYK